MQKYIVAMSISNIATFNEGPSLTASFHFEHTKTNDAKIYNSFEEAHDAWLEWKGEITRESEAYHWNVLENEDDYSIRIQAKLGDVVRERLFLGQIIPIYIP